MKKSHTKVLKTTANAKINLTLNIVGKRNNYHLLESLVVFSKFGDEIKIYEGNQDSLKITGEFSSIINDKQNIIMKAIQLIKNAFNIKKNYSVHLIKNIPVSAGLGGGSANAAAIIKTILKSESIIIDSDIKQKKLNKILKKLGADVPMCYFNNSCFVKGIGDNIIPYNIEKFPLLLINPRKEVATEKIFKKFSEKLNEKTSEKPSEKFSKKLNEKNYNTKNIPLKFNTFKFIRDNQNELFKTACNFAPEIANIIEKVHSFNFNKNHYATNMSGSGSTVFVIFKNEKECEYCYNFFKKNTKYWVKTTKIL